MLEDERFLVIVYLKEKIKFFVFICGKVIFFVKYYKIMFIELFGIFLNICIVIVIYVFKGEYKVVRFLIVNIDVFI